MSEKAERGVDAYIDAERLNSYIDCLQADRSPRAVVLGASSDAGVGLLRMAARLSAVGALNRRGGAAPLPNPEFRDTLRQRVLVARET